VVADGETGLLVDPRSVAAAVEEAVRLVEDRELAERLGARGREVARRERGWPAAVARVDALLGELAP
jgi:glycosyltransferase involved in cell wall biosynthesis